MPLDSTMDPRLSGRAIAVVEDNAAIRDVIVQSLSGLGHRPQHLEPAEAIARLRAEPPDVLVLDIDLGAHSGAAIYAALRANPATRALPVVFCTVLRENTVGRKVSGGGRLNDAHAFFLYKPFTISGLYCAVSTALGVDPRELPPLGVI